MTRRSNPSRLFPGIRLATALAALAAGTLSLWASDESYVTTPLMQEETRLLIQLLQNVHFKGEEINRDQFQRLLDEFLKELDPQRLFLLETDRVQTLASHAPTLEKDLKWRGTLDAAYDSFRLYRQRVTDRIEWLRNEIEREFDFNGNATFITDRSELPWPADPDASDELWRNRIKYELIQDILNDLEVDEAKERFMRRYERMLRNLDDFEARDIQEMFLSTLTRMFDPHSTYFSSDTLEDFSISMKLSLVGIGALLADEDGYCVVREIIPGGPADLDGQLRPKDRIIAVGQKEEDSVDIIGMKLRRIVEMIRGEKGTEVTLTIVPADAADSSTRREIVLTRDVVKLNSSRAQASIHEVPDRHGNAVPIGVISLPSFYGSGDGGGPDDPPSSASADVEELIEKLKAANIHGLVLDLRGNGGGLLSEAIEVTGLFIPKGPVVQIKDSGGQVNIRPDTNPRVSYHGPLAVLVSRYSASASEIVAGALQNYGRAIVVGDTSTHGKGTVQAVLEMRNFLNPYWRERKEMGAAKLTVQKFYLPNGASTQNRGVIPDIRLPSVDQFLPIGEADLPNALAWDTIDPIYFPGSPLDEDLITRLNEASAKRQDSLEEFDHLHRNIEWFRERQERKEVSLNLEERRRLKEIDDTFRKQMREERKTLAALNFSHKDIRLADADDNELVQQDVVHPFAEDTDAGAPVDADVEGEEREDDGPGPRFDIPLRETMRVLVDTLELLPQHPLWAAEPPALSTAKIP